MNPTIFLILASSYLIVIGSLSIFSKNKYLKNIFPINIIRKIIMMRFNIKKNDKYLQISPGATTITIGALILIGMMIYYLINNSIIQEKYFVFLIPAVLVLIIVFVPLFFYKIKKSIT